MSATYLIKVWCYYVHLRFVSEHPTGQGVVISNFYWEFSWIGIVVGALLTAVLIICHVKKRHSLYEATFYFGMWLLIVWFGFSLSANEASFLGYSGLTGRRF